MSTTLNRIHTVMKKNTPAYSPDELARALWSIIAEPGDQQVGELITALGAADALSLVLEETATMYEQIDVATIRAKTLPRISEDSIVQAFSLAAGIGATLITREHPHWPTGLGDLGTTAPHALWVRGNSHILANQPATAIVGARAATGYGEHVCMEITAGLVERGHTITSGAAYGIDGMAHRAALASNGPTIAYLAGGVDRYYPAGHDALLARIGETGAIAAEIGCGQPPTKWRFLMRNRLIAATTCATIVVEAGHRSGSLNTAGHAAALGRPLGAVPGPVTSAASAGCHRLIRDYGATLITNADEAAQL